MRMDYQWRKYAFLNRGIEVERHFGRVQDSSLLGRRRAFFPLLPPPCRN